ncbi:mitochondrial N-acyl-phosphatidylethanolamine-hydrolyzing phospholipase D [Podospora australis]|uniref:Mitochondrial N-acyl-phosphatidylethanolamine-hydrolyzing phospholipase D n=1 Tax=Podospora australis TaxID=1536484 RepID=A0AAN6WVA1_9PEZI|nr:mitochondrial N-acyl-phosphatidylethanolamine-hydrolyzing phospholipase D [Podospora australis]
MAPSAPNFGTPLSITHIGTATALIHVGDDVTFITDPVFSPAGTEWDVGVTVLKLNTTPALGLADVPPIDAVLLSHEDHADNLDELGRRLLDGRVVLTTPDGAKNLAPRPGVQALRPWETTTVKLGSQTFEVTGTPCSHLPGGEVTGFIVTAPSFGKSSDGKPNAIYFSGDTIYLPELAKMKDEFHISVALLNLGKATVSLPDQDLVITLDGENAAKLFKEIEADVFVPMHFESWGHFYETKGDLQKSLEAQGVAENVLWLEPGKKTQIVQS